LKNKTPFLNQIHQIIILLLIFSSSSLTGQEFNNKHENIINNIIQSSLREQKGFKMLKELCQIGPRFSASQQSIRAIFWAKEKMKRIRCDSVWLQEVVVPNWKRGNIETALIINNNKNLNIAALGGSVGTPAKGISGKILEVHSFEELQTKAEQANGKIIFFNRPFDHGFVNTFAGYSAAVNQRSNGAVEAAKVGGTAALVRSVTSRYDNVPHTGSMRYADSLKKIPAVAIGQIDADYLSKIIKENPQYQVQLDLSCQTFQDTVSYNVIGEIRGSEFPDEIILVGGHFDSWDKGHGAHDDGAGCIQTLEVLDLFKRLNIILFIQRTDGVSCPWYLSSRTASGTWVLTAFGSSSKILVGQILSPRATTMD